MRELLVVIDYQNDFVTGALGNPAAAALERAETESDLAEIRHELAVSGYGSRMRGYKPGKNAPVKPMEFRTSGGYRVLCGKNNMQNEFVTFRAAGKLDLKSICTHRVPLEQTARGFDLMVSREAIKVIVDIAD